MDKLNAESITLARDLKRHQFHKWPTELYHKFIKVAGHLACFNRLIPSHISNSLCQSVDAQRT